MRLFYSYILDRMNEQVIQEYYTTPLALSNDISVRAHIFSLSIPNSPPSPLSQSLKLSIAQLNLSPFRLLYGTAASYLLFSPTLWASLSDSCLVGAGSEEVSMGGETVGSPLRISVLPLAEESGPFKESNSRSTFSCCWVWSLRNFSRREASISRLA